MIHPISYSFPDELWVNVVPKKTMMFASHTPKNVSNSGYSFSDNTKYMEIYQQSVFGITSKKCGWDCWRHLEILSQGAAMYMLDIGNIPNNHMVHYPKGHIHEFMNKYGQYSLEFLQKHASSILHEDLTQLLNESKKNLSSSAMFEYILEKSEHKNANNIYFPCGMRDYIFYSLHYAGKKSLGHNFVEHSIGNEDTTSFLYKDYAIEDSLKLYGRGFNYSRLLDSSLKSTLSMDDLHTKVKAREFDCIITTKNNNNIMNYLEYYEPSEIIVICCNDCDPLYHPHAGWVTTDSHTCNFRPLADMHFFMREI